MQNDKKNTWGYDPHDSYIPEEVFATENSSEVSRSDRNKPKTTSKSLRGLSTAVFAAITFFIISLAAFLFLTQYNKVEPPKTISTDTIASVEKKYQPSDPLFKVIASPDNPEHKVIANNSAADSLGGTENEKITRILFEAQHNPTVLEGYARSFGIKYDPNISWTTTVNGKSYLSREAREVFFKLKKVLTSADVKNVDNVGVSGYATGIKNGQFFEDSKIRSYEGWDGMKIQDGKYVYYVLNWCGNVIHPKDTPNIPNKELPIPPQNPTPEKPKDPQPTPDPTPDPQPTPEAKKPNLDPVQQGNASVGGGAFENPSIGEPTPEPTFVPSYQAPAQNTGGNGGGNSSNGNAPVSNSVGGSFSDSNGTTTITNDGAVTTPSSSYAPLNDKLPIVEPGASNQNGNDAMSEPPMED